MSTRVPSHPLRSIALLAGLAALGACLDGPFAHANPHDPDSPIRLTIEGGLDTVTVAGEFLQFRLVTDPLLEDVRPQWSSSAPWFIAPYVKGSFFVSALPLEPTDVTVSAYIGAKVATRTITLLPAAP